MKRLTLALAATGTAALAAAAPAVASPDVTVTPAQPAASWTGPVANGLNTSWYVDFVTKAGTCSNTDELSRCDTTRVFVDADPSQTTAPTVTFRMDGFKATDDFDIRVYDGGTTGKTRGAKLGSPNGDVAATSPLGGLDPRHTGPGDFETTTVTGSKNDRWYFVDIVYFTVAQGSYTGKVSVAGLKAPESAAGTTAKRLKARRAAAKRRARAAR